MEKVILIAGISGELSTEMLQEALSRRFQTIVAMNPEAEHPPIGEDWERLLRYLEWNKRSSLSAKSLVLEVLSFADALDEVFLVFEPPKDGRPLHELPVAEIEKVFDEWMKGFLFLSKELIFHFQRRKKGTLTFVQYEPIPIITPLSLGSSAFFRAMGNALFTQYQNEPFIVRGFQSHTEDVKDFARFLLAPREKPEKTYGKWTKYSGKSSFWSFGRSGS
ncbi:MAG: hypothetical protein N2442_03495 [Spirochaetes bacterium]|nr:hypothetical protein [Spirochaetota bacterium]